MRIVISNFLFWLFLFSTVPPAFSQDNGANPAEQNNTGPAKQSKTLKNLQEAQKLYNEAMEDSRLGRQRPAKKKLKKSLRLLSVIMAERGLIESLKPDFDDMAEKIHDIETGLSTEAPTALLEVSDEEILNTAPMHPVAADDRKKYAIKIDPENQLTQRYLAFYAKGPRRNLVMAALERSGRYRGMISRALAENSLPKELFYLVMVESEYKVKGHSRAGAAGLWQFMPATARKLGLKVNYWIDERLDPEKSTQAAIKYLKELYELFDDWHLALAAYNRGEHGIGKDLQFAKAVEFGQLSSRDVLPQETEHFVPKFMACVLLGESPQAYDFRPNYEEPESYDKVVMPRALDLKIAAQCAGTSEETIQRLNPAVRAWCTPINYPDFELKIPAGTKDKFLEELAKVKDWNPSRGFVRHKVVKGEILGKIARKYATTVEIVMKDNKLSSPKRLKPGQVLMIRPGKAYFSK
ncbi:MAG: transglycosylase SLT domain-containing protein [Elusimicrobia bacterium]|nr:transglycosylase SLT domain-containing protein [Elusimicrobiota bacterium]